MADAIEVETDIFDLRRFGYKDEGWQSRGHLYERIDAAERHLSKSCEELDVLNLREYKGRAVKLYSRILERPCFNSHGETELWVTRACTDLYHDSPHFVSFRRRTQIPDGAVLCIDTQKVLSFGEIATHPHMFVSHPEIYGYIRSAIEKERFIPGHQMHFLEIGAISYCDIGNSWMFGVYGRGFRENVRAEQ